MALSEYRGYSAAVDDWTFIHFLFGLGFAAAGLSYPLTFAAAVLYEAIEEDWMIQKLGFFGDHPPIETMDNKFIDVLAVITGRIIGGEILEPGPAGDLELEDIIGPLDIFTEDIELQQIELAVTAVAVDPELLQFPIPIPICCLF